MRYLSIFLFSISLQSLHGQGLLTVTAANQPPYNPVSLIDNYFTGAGIQVLDVQYAGVPSAAGFFSGGTTAVGLERGLVMTTGRASTYGASYFGVESEGLDFASTDIPSNEYLPELAPISGGALNDVVYYRITFKPSSDSIRFQYVFASEEYPEFACSSFNDIFAFFLDGPRPGNSTPYQHFNIALIPGTNLPVAINNIHPANPNYNCPALNELYYIDNFESDLQPVYDGFTIPFVAEAAVVPCETYVMTLAIADVSDGIYDSGVFLEGNSFGGAIEVGASFGPTENVIPENAQGDTVAILFSNIPAAVLPLTVTIGGDAENGVDYQTIDTLYTISSADSVLYLLFQPIADTLHENQETLLINVSGTGCLAQQFTLLISDPDSSMLQGEMIYALVNGTAQLAAFPTAVSATDFNFSNETDVVINATNTMAVSEILVDLPFANLNDIHTIQSVCFDIAHNWVDDLDIYLIAPDFRFVELSTDNGGNGDNYTATCFSPDATSVISFPGPFAPPSAAPFTGVFQPEGVWNDILNVPVNGVWKLAVVDDNTNITGTLLNWSVQFSGARFGSFTYEWSTGETTPTIDVHTPGTYTVTVRNAVSHLKRTFIVTDECPHTQITRQVCAGGQFVLGETTFDAEHPSGTVTFDLPGVGCDSSVFVQLEFLPEATDSMFAVIPAGDTLYLGNQFFTDAGNYTVHLNTLNGCDSLVYLQLEVTSGTGMPEAHMLLIQPNPARDQVIVTWDKELMVSVIRIFDRSGKLVLERKVSAFSQEERMDVGDFPMDTYLMTLETANGVLVRKLVKG